ncbi:MAG: relaxase domain-containing protein, partial [Chroococcidiopsidaceae cyanobacterium CP_BM_ER_R8_30]|nr:relaxase domain-containing protein [Chroococcidiopsidaceae cyanobacterium CP_BM_ER_R8_30]
MMTPKNIKAKTAIEYFKKGYYAQGEWLGQGAKTLGLKGEIKEQQVYENVVKGFSPDGSQRLNQRGVDENKRKAAVDCTFNAPKSLSITALIGGDERLLEAHNQAVEEVLRILEERYAQTRIMVDGKTQEVVKTGNLIIAKHDHIETRKLDPHIHSHCLVMNATQAPNQEWYSHLNDAIFRNQKLLGMMYQHHLAAKVEKLGYEIEWKDHGQFDIKGYSEKDLMEFSKRRKQILAVAGPHSTWAERERAWKKTRDNKEYVPPDELKARWREEAKALLIEIVRPREPRPELEPAPIGQELFNDAIKHCSEKRVAFKVEDIEKFILSHSYQTVNLHNLQSLIDSSNELIRLEYNNQLRYTTQRAVQMELATIRLMQEGQKTVAAITHPEVIEHYLEEIRLKQEQELNHGQRQAVILSLTTNDQFVAWQGVAGAGKTFALEPLKALAEAQGYVVKGFAPSAKAARVLAKDIKSETQTVAQLLCSKMPEEVQSNQIWVVDEAGLLSTKDAHALLQRAKAEQARVILVGDTKQLSAVEAGNPFKSLQQRGIETAYLNESKRQKDPNLKLAVDLLADGCIEDGFRRLVTDGRIKTVDAGTLVHEMVQAYVKLTPEERRETLLLAGTNEQRRIITAELRKELKAEGSLGEDVTLTQLKAKDLSEVEKQSYLSHFAVGDVVIPLRDYKRKDLVKGEQYEIVGKTADKLQLQGTDGTQLAVDLNFKKAVFEREQIQIAVGDRLMWKKNNQALEQVNGEEVLVKAINGNQVELEQQDGKTRTIDLSQPHHLDHALVRTTYSSQGETADRVLIAADAAIGQESFYVAASRARHELCFFTQNPKELLRWALESRAQENALDLLRQQLERQMQLEVAKASQSSASDAVVERPQPKQNSRVLATNSASQSTVAPPIKRTDKTPKPTVAAPVKRSNQPPHLQPAPTHLIAQPKQSPHRRIAQPPVKHSEIEAFWTPGNVGEAPIHIEPQHWKERVEGSAIHPDLAQSNVQSVSGRGVYERLLSTKLEQIGGSGQYVTQPVAKLMRSYEGVAQGGWWAEAGIDARSLLQIQPGEQPENKLWGSFKADHPRLDAAKSQHKGKTEFIKYEHPLAEERQLFLFKVPDALAERIYSKHNITPTEAEKQSGFWHVVHKYNLPITLTEGAKKTLSSLSQGEITIGLSGVNGGYTSRDRDKNRLEQRVLHPELQVFATPSRDFRFAFDQDTKLSTIFNVRRELVHTGELLEQAGCNVRVVQWQGDKGLDDLIVNQGPLAYAQAHSKSIPLEWETKKHYRSEYTRLARQVRNSQPALPGEAVDVEVYKLAVSKGDIRDGARVIAQSDQARAFKTELLPQEANARTLGYIQQIEQQLYQSLTKKAESSQVAEQVGSQPAPISVTPPSKLSSELDTQPQEISHERINPQPSGTSQFQQPRTTEPQQRGTTEPERSRTAEPQQPRTADDGEIRPDFARDRGIEDQSPELASGSRAGQDQSEQLAAGVGANQVEPYQFAIGAGELYAAIVRATDLEEIEQYAGHFAEFGRVLEQCQHTLGGSTELRAAIAGLYERIEAGLKPQAPSTTPAHEPVRGERQSQSDSIYGGARAESEQYTSGKVLNAIVEYIEQSALESEEVIQELEALRESLAKLQTLPLTQAIQQLSEVISSSDLSYLTQDHSFPPPQIREANIEPYQFSINPEELSEVIIEASEQEELQQPGSAFAELEQRLRTIQIPTASIENLRATVEQFNTGVNAEIEGQTDKELVTAIINYVEQTAIEESASIAQALAELTGQLDKFPTGQFEQAVTALNTTVAKGLEQLRASSVETTSPEEIRQQLIAAIAGHVELTALESEPFTQALGSLAERLSQFPDRNLTGSIEQLNAVISNHLKENTNPVIQVAPVDESISPAQLTKPSEIKPYQFAIGAEELTQTINEAVEQEALQQLAQPVIELTQTLRNQQFSTVKIDDFKAAVEQVRARVQQESKQTTPEECLDVIANYIEEEALNSEALAQALTALTHNLTQFRAGETVSVVEELNTVISHYLPQSAVSSLELDQETCEQLATAIEDYLASSALESEEVTAGLEQLNSSLNQLCTDDTVQAIEELNSTISNYKAMNIPGLDRSLVDGNWVRSDKLSPEQFDQLFNVIEEKTLEQPNSQQSQSTDGSYQVALGRRIPKSRSGSPRAMRRLSLDCNLVSDIGGRARTQLESVSDQARPHRSHDESTAITGAVRSGEPADASPTTGFEALGSVTQRAEQSDRPHRTDGAASQQSERPQPTTEPIHYPSGAEVEQPTTELQHLDQDAHAFVRRTQSTPESHTAMAPTTTSGITQPPPGSQSTAGQARSGIRANLESVEQLSQAVNQSPAVSQSKPEKPRPGVKADLAGSEQVNSTITQPQPITRPTSAQPRPGIRTTVKRCQEASRRLNSARQSLAALTQQLRDTPLVELAPHLGLEPDRHDKHKWRTEGQILSINGQKFYDHLAQKGGYGAIDFVMHVNQLPFKEAVQWLSQGSSSGNRTTAIRQTEPKTPAVAKHTPFQPPTPDES